MDTPNYIKSLIIPRNGQKARDRRAWGIELSRVWLPFLTACNTAGELAVPADALGAPLRLAYNADGSVKFSKTGRPVMRVARDIADNVRLIKDNFTTNLLDYASEVMDEMPDQFQAQIDKAQKAGAPIIQRDNRSLDKAVALATAEALKEAKSPKAAAPLKGEKEPVAAAVS
ncbi:hypothetical protein ES708_00211 [subsurface metagenome]